MSALQWITALMPVISVAVLLVALRMPAARAMPLALIITVILTLTVWGVQARYVGASIIEGLIIASSVLLIVFGAVALLSVMRASGGLDAIRTEFTRLSADSRVQLLLIGWLFVSFIEGAAGFGTPAPVVAPLLIALGFRPLAAVALTLMADVSAVTFGAVGTPILVGIATGVGLNPTDPQDYETLREIALTEVAMDIPLAIILTVSMTYLLTMKFGNQHSRQAFTEALPLAVVAAFLFTVPAWLVTRFIGIEFGGLVGALIGMLVFVGFIRLGWLIPKRTWTVRDGYVDELSDADAVEAEAVEAAAEAVDAVEWPAWKVWGPYLLLVALLLFTRLVDPVRETLTGITVGLTDIDGTGISSTFAPLYSPGFIFLIVVVITYFVQGVPPDRAQPMVRSTAKSILGTGIVLAAAVPIVRVFLNSGVNSEGLAAMPLELATAASGALGTWWPLAAPFIGALGSFISGSATFSHLMFAELQANVADTVGVDQQIVLAQQIGGANAGNMVCVVNVVAVAGVTGMLGQEGAIIRQTVVVMAMYTAAFAVLGFLLTL